ncbi:hypothetical protein GCM10007880_15580 [Mesorhizobium amorphae]|uniref:Uncharacterized protein n=1 Tax=Mesorhizobium amorphae CCNWGS0123 TaxID=1082933 RepID=G6YAQ1_9HYPH|nr:hypothetical protein MEA186_15117 [Mesorhizobium amorphae CCNWGS0123]GLR41042.1 hypothetical protein GCM10007880_15580 [Mesorhizobium amorphae]
MLPFTLALPYANFEWTMVLTVLIGLILSSASSNSSSSRRSWCPDGSA